MRRPSSFVPESGSGNSGRSHEETAAGAGERDPFLNPFLKEELFEYDKEYEIDCLCISLGGIFFTGGNLKAGKQH